jgi:hypothetical protein
MMSEMAIRQSIFLRVRQSFGATFSEGFPL